MDFKKQYIKMRNEGGYDLQFFYDYYLSKGGMVVNPNEFVEYFTYNITPHPVFKQMLIRQEERDRESILNFLDSVFDLTILKDKNSNVIRVIC